jgi:hypothetical protein
MGILPVVRSGIGIVPMIHGLEAHGTSVHRSQAIALAAYGLYSQPRQAQRLHQRIAQRFQEPARIGLPRVANPACDPCLQVRGRTAFPGAQTPAKPPDIFPGQAAV